MKENLIDVNTDNNDNDYIHSLRPSENINNVSLVKHISDMPLKDENKGSELMLRKTINHMKKTNKLHRYKIGLIFYSIYIAVNMVELIVTILYKYNFDYEPFCETYLRYSAFTILLFLSPFLNKTNSSKLFDIINITKYYIPDWKKKKNGNLSSVFYVFEGTEEKFNKTVHKISFLYMILIYLSMSFYLFSYIKASKDIQAYIIPILFPMGSILIIIFLRKFFLHTQNLDLLSKISLVFIFISVVLLFIFQFSIFEENKPFEIFGFSFIGGVFFGMFSTFLKYYSNIYGENFRFTSVLGYIGLFTLITVPFLICLICLFNEDLDSHFNLFSTGNGFIPYLILFLCSFVKFFCTFHCIISLSPLVFSLAIFFNMLLNIIINIFWGYIKSHWTFYVAAVFLILGVSGGILDKYLKNSIKASNSKKEILSERNGEKGEDLLIADIQKYKSNDDK
jgi:drug/metabolite transporter (DMT)-like permease